MKLWGNLIELEYKQFLCHSKLLCISKTTCFSDEVFAIVYLEKRNDTNVMYIISGISNYCSPFELCKYLRACWHASKTDLPTLHIKTDLPILHIKPYFYLFSNILTLIFFRYSFSSKNISKGFPFCNMLLSLLN